MNVELEAYLLVLSLFLVFLYKCAKLFVLNYEIRGTLPKEQDKNSLTFSMKN